MSTEPNQSQPQPGTRLHVLKSDPTLDHVVSQLCTHAQMTSREFKRWCDIIREEPRLHRKVWEYCYILAALEQTAMLRPGRRGLAFGVGREPLAAVAAAAGCSIVATDMDAEEAARKGWATEEEAQSQHAAALEDLNARGICPPEVFAERVQFRTADMTAIPEDFVDFDFVWSSCALEHLGTLELGLEFVRNSLSCLKPGGVAVHTTEFNLSSNDQTIAKGPVSLYRRRDIVELARALTEQGHQIMLNFNSGDGWLDRHVDVPPYNFDRHLRLELGSYAITSIGLIIRKAI